MVALLFFLYVFSHLWITSICIVSKLSFSLLLVILFVSYDIFHSLDSTLFRIF